MIYILYFILGTILTITIIDYIFIKLKEVMI